jgi:hypothetical protein
MLELLQLLKDIIEQRSISTLQSSIQLKSEEKKKKKNNVRWPRDKTKMIMMLRILIMK